MKGIIKAITILLVIMLTLAFSSCSQAIRPSREYYVNDFADVMLDGAKDTILLESQRLYDATKKNTKGGAKLVVTTLLIDEIEEIDDISADDLFTSWRLGDMGILVLLVFVKDNNSKRLLNVFINIGSKMQDNISTDYAVELLEDTLFNPQWEGYLDMGLGHFYYELLSRVYIEVYGYQSFNYDIDEYETYIYSGGVTDTQKPMTAIGYVFSPHSPSWIKIVIMLPIFVIAGILFFVFQKRRRM